MQNEIESAGKCVTGWVCTLMCVRTRGATVCVCVCECVCLGLAWVKVFQTRQYAQRDEKSTISILMIFSALCETLFSWAQASNGYIGLDYS